MLRRARAAAAIVAGLARAAPAFGAEPVGGSPAEVPRAIREPVRLTAGGSSELMGVLTPDEQALYFLSDASGTLDILRQFPVQSGPVTVSSGLGDAAWPQISPDGTRIAYLAFKNDAIGDVCLRTISHRETGGEKCFTRPGSAELIVHWLDDSSLAVLSREELHGNFQLLEMPIDGSPPRTLLARDMVGLAISPDRRWLAYIPVQRQSETVGVTFSQRTARGVGLQRLDQAGAALPYLPPLPGVTGSVAFTETGDFLIFTQFLNDTNRDGRIDGDDNAVLFRVPFRGTATMPVDQVYEPEQLTSARWDCHYPSPAKTQLIASCSHEGSLDVYSLPLEGAVPHEWDDARLAGEIAVARDLWSRLLLSARRLALAPAPRVQEAIVREMMALHLELGEYESAIYYAEHRLTSPEAAAYGRIVAELARHRRAEIDLIRGETSAAYIESERARANRLRKALPGAPASLAELARLVISEIEDDIGEKAAALTTFVQVELDQLEGPLVAKVAAQRAERLYRLRADRQALLDVYRTLSGLPALAVGTRLEYAQRFVDELRRGQSRAARGEAIQAARALVADESELALLLDVEQALSSLDDSTEEAVRAAIFELYKQNKAPERRRALVLATLRAAAQIGNEYVQYQFVTSWASSLDRRQPERKYAEALYNLIVLDRAYGEQRQGKIGEARGYFYGSTVATDSLEAHIGFIEARIAEGGGDVERKLDEIYEKRFQREPHSPVYTFVRAYRLARQLPKEADAQRHEQIVTQVLDGLRRVAAAFPKDAQVHQLWGFALHQRARRSGSREAAVAANREYLLALDLARDDERLSATLLHRLGLLQASLGNHGAALRHLLQRDQLPHVRPLEELGLRVAIAQSAWHTADTELAKKQMLMAAQLIQKAPEFARFEPLALDRAGLALLAAGDTQAAQDRYEKLEALLQRDPEATPLNRVKARLGLAASALTNGRPEVALQALDRAEQVLNDSRDLDPEPSVVWRRSLLHDYRYSRTQYRALVEGLRASAAREQGDYPAALRAMERRVEFLEQRLEQSQADEDRLELAQAYHHLAELRYRVEDVRGAALAVERGLTVSHHFDQNTGSEVNDAGLALVRDYAELHLYGGLPLSALRRDLRGELQRAYAAICKFRSPRWAEQRFLFATYLTELSLKDSSSAAPGANASIPPTARSSP